MVPRTDNFRCLVLALALLAACFATNVAVAQSDPLPSWNPGTTKQGIIDFVARVTRSGEADFVPEERRVAVFDNDGTLWAEQPVYFQLAFALDEIRKMAPAHPEWSERQPFKAVLDGDDKALATVGERGLLEIIEVTHAGMSTEAFNGSVDKWLKEARHPRFKCPYIDLVYQPMIELLGYLRSNGFKTFIVSGGGVEFMRRFAEKVYGIPPEQVIGSSGVVKFELGSDGKVSLIKEPKIDFIDDGPGKPVGINRAIGRQPIFAFGNSDGDQQMLEYTASGDGPHFMGLVHHTDAKREWAYDRNSKIGKLDKALDEATARGWTVVDMKTDWRAVFPAKK